MRKYYETKWEQKMVQKIPSAKNVIGGRRFESFQLHDIKSYVSDSILIKIQVLHTFCKLSPN